jgi:MFS family permease
MGASTSLLLFGIGMMGTLFMTVLAFVNLWGYSELEAALAVTPVPLTAMVVSPIVGRLSSRVPPRVFGVPALVVMSLGLWALSGIPVEPSLWRAVWSLALVGAGVGATFPAVSIGSMGAVQGQELGLASGIVNMARQVGFAVGIALLVAVFTGAVGDDVTNPEVVRDAYGAAFRVAALVTLLAIPFSLMMRRSPVQVAAAEVPAAAG